MFLVRPMMGFSRRSTSLAGSRPAE